MPPVQHSPVRPSGDLGARPDLVTHGYPSEPRPSSLDRVSLMRPESWEQPGNPVLGAPGTVAEYDPNAGPQIRCDQCGRSFAETALAKHEKICRKVFVEKRKKFNSVKARLDCFNGAQDLIANATKLERERAQGSRPKDKKRAKWRQDSATSRGDPGCPVGGRLGAVRRGGEACEARGGGREQGAVPALPPHFQRGGGEAPCAHLPAHLREQVGRGPAEERVRDLGPLHHDQR